MAILSLTSVNIYIFFDLIEGCIHRISQEHKSIIIENKFQIYFILIPTGILIYNTGHGG